MAKRKVEGACGWCGDPVIPHELARHGTYDQTIRAWLHCGERRCLQDAHGYIQACFWNRNRRQVTTPKQRLKDPQKELAL